MHSIFLALLLSAQFSQQIVVTAERGETPLEETVCAITTIDPVTLQAMPGTSAAEVLSLVPGVTMFSASDTTPATITLRGFYGGGEVDHVQLRIDGIPLADAESNLAPWQQIRAEEIERVEVVRGLASPLYGDAALGGIVQMFTRRHDAQAASATFTYGNFGSTDIAASAFVPARNGELAAFLDWRESDGQRDHSAAGRRGARVQWRSSLFSAAADWRTNDRDDPGPLPLAAIDSDASESTFADDRDDTTRGQLALSANGVRWSASLHATSKTSDTTRTILVLPPFADTATRELDSGEIAASGQLSGETWRAGLDAATQRFDADWGTAESHANENREAIGAWATRRLHLSARTLLVGSLRFDSIDDATAWSPRVGIVTNFGLTSMYASAGRGFKAPTLEQLYDVRPLSLFGDTFTISNPDLEPQRARSLETGASRRERFGRWSIDAYLTRVTNEIDFDPRTFRYGNIARSEHRGVELMFEAPPARVTPRVTYAWSRVFSLDDDAHAQLKNVPEHSATAMLIAQLPRGFTSTLFYAWNAGRWYDDGETIAAPDTRSLSLRVQKDLGPAALRIDILNALDATNAGLGYALTSITGDLAAYAYPDVGRTVRVSLRWSGGF